MDIRFPHRVKKLKSPHPLPYSHGDDCEKVPVPIIVTTTINTKLSSQGKELFGIRVR
jgi:hypothetical protein